MYKFQPPQLLILCTCFLWQTAIANEQTTRPAVEYQSVQKFIKKMVKKHQFNQGDLEQLFVGIKFRVWTKDDIKHQKRKKKPALNWPYYRSLFLTNYRINKGLEFWQTHQKTLQRAEEKFAVPAQIIVAILGIETNYGINKGKYPTFATLVRKSFNGYSRSKFYERELEHFLLLTRANNFVPLAIMGSHAGAMGYAQFISSSYRHYAIDFDNDNKVDLFYSPADAIGSIAHYFAKHHWQKDVPIAKPLPQLSSSGKKLAFASPTKPKTSLKIWQSRRIDIVQNTPLQNKAEIIVLADDNAAEYWLTLDNFYILTRYNHSNLYAMAVYQLSEILATRMKK